MRHYIRIQNQPKTFRAGYTLVEILVVVAILAVLAGLTALFMPGFEATERSSTGASNLQQWLLIAKQRALLDRAPRGVRLFRDAKKPNYITSAQYIEQPEDFNGGMATTDPTDKSIVLLIGVDVTGGQDPNDQSLWPVQPGDYFQSHDAGLMHRIFRLTPLSATSARLELANGPNPQDKSPLPYDIKIPTENYRIVRQPRPLGEETLSMPHAVGADLTTNMPPFSQFLLPFNADGSIDILFAPSGAVLGNFASDKLVFWIREYSDDMDPFQGDPSLIVVFTRSGLVESFEINERNKANPYPPMN